LGFLSLVDVSSVYHYTPGRKSKHKKL
jgi:hypothetical protein